MKLWVVNKLKTIKLTVGELPPENFTGIVEWENENKEYYKNGKFHREDGPVVEWNNGYKEWFITGKLHREDGPAIIFPNGDEYWYREGNQHRINGPAVKYSNGSCYNWIIDSWIYCPHILNWYFGTALYLGKEKGKYDLVWLKFLTERGIEEFPIIPGMEQDLRFKEVFDKFLDPQKEMK